MPVALPEVRIGEPSRHESLAVFPLFCDSEGGAVYRLSAEALADESLLIEEVDEQGSVPDLLVDNRGEVRVLFLEGEELVGAKQNRVLNTSVLVPARSKTKIPVSCVEQGRWQYQSRRFRSSGSHSPSKLRRSLKASVSRSVKDRRGHKSDQSEVWKQVSQLQSAHGVGSDTGAMSDVFDAFEEQIATYRDKLQYIDGGTGLAVAIGQQVVMLDLFDKPATCQKVWERFLTGVVFDALEAGPSERQATGADIRQLLDTAEKLPWQPADHVGEGDEYRAESDRGDHLSVLTLQQTMIHGSIVAAD